MTKFKDRCSCMAISTNRRCKLSGKGFNIQNKNYCYTHATMLFAKSANIIKKVFVGFLVRKKLKNIFYLLPHDLQRKIIGYNREPYLLKQYHYKPIQRILDKRYKNDLLYSEVPMVGTPDYYGHGVWVAAVSPIRVVEYYTKIIDLYKLYNKYIQIANRDCCMALCRYASPTLLRVDKNINNDYTQMGTDMWALKKCLHSAVKDFIHTVMITYPDDIRMLAYVYGIPYLSLK